MTLSRTARATALIAVLALCGSGGAPAAERSPAAPPGPNRAVVVLNSERPDFPAVTAFERGLREGLIDAEGRTQIYVEYLDNGRFPSPEDQAAFAQHLRERYAGHQIDVVVLFEEPALDFGLAHRAALFPGVPLVVAAVERQRLERRALPPGIASVPIAYDYRRTLELALALQPDLREVVLVRGLADFDLRRGEEARRALDALAPRLRYRELSGQPLPAIEKSVRRLPPGSAVLLASMVRDAEDRALVGRDYAGRLAAASSVPVYGIFASYLAQGTLAGAITDFTAIGGTTAIVVAQILAGRRPAAIEPPPAPWRVSWPALAKWGIPPERVPGDAQIVFREPGLWDRYRNLTLATVAVFLLQSLLIAGLLLQRKARRQAESALRQSEETLRLAVAALPTAIVMANEQGTIVLANARAEQLLGYAAAELTGQSVEVLVPERFRDSHPGRRRGYFLDPAARAMSSRREIQARRKDGAEVPVEVGLNPIRTRDEVLVVAAIVDLTDRRDLKRKQEELEHVTRVSTMGEIAASLAHELSQPLTAILSNAQAGLRLLERGAGDTAEIHEILADIVADDKRAGEVIGALRAMLRRGRTEMEPIDVADAVRHVLSLLHGEFVREQVEVDTVLDGPCPALASRTQIEQVIMNLAMNGIEAVRPQPPGGRRLRIAASVPAAGGVEVNVRDSGVGIPAGERDKVFTAFWTTKAHGMGMGLAVCRSIIRSHGGDIRVEPNEDQGVTFSFTLPPAPPGAGPAG